jgi:hypothetical protein
LRPFLCSVLGDQGSFGLRERNSALVLKGAAAIAKILDGAFRFEAVAMRFVDRIAGNPKLVASHTCGVSASASPALNIAAYRAFLLRDLGDAPALGRSQCDGSFIGDEAAAISKKFDGPLSFETISVIFVILVALEP